MIEVGDEEVAHQSVDSTSSNVTLTEAVIEIWPGTVGPSVTGDDDGAFWMTFWTAPNIRPLIPIT